MRKHTYQTLIILLLLPCIVPCLTLRPVHAELITTSDILSHADSRDALAKVTAFMQRQDVQDIMVQQGVDIEEARARLQAMSDAELQALAGQIDNLPAGGDAVGAVLGAALIVFLVLLVTDILGLTHVFSFVNR